VDTGAKTDIQLPILHLRQKGPRGQDSTKWGGLGAEYKAVDGHGGVSNWEAVAAQPMATLRQFRPAMPDLTVEKKKAVAKQRRALLDSLYAGSAWVGGAPPPPAPGAEALREIMLEQGLDEDGAREVFAGRARREMGQVGVPAAGTACLLVRLAILCHRESSRLCIISWHVSSYPVEDPV
jgi:hypothetical protein